VTARGDGDDQDAGVDAAGSAHFDAGRPQGLLAMFDEPVEGSEPEPARAAGTA
jgi:hypothetical protein